MCVKENPLTSRSVPDAEVRAAILRNIGADMYPLHETRLSICCGWWRELHDLGARILGLEAANVRGDVVNLLVRFRVMNIGKSTLVNTRSETVAVGRQSSLQTVEMRISSGKPRTLASLCDK